MKKYIPKNTDFCYGCKWYRQLPLNFYDREHGCEYADICTQDCKTQKTPCGESGVMCQYSNFIDYKLDSKLKDSVKICRVSLGGN